MRLLVAALSLAVLATTGCGGEDPFAPSKREVNPGAFGVAGGLDELAAEPAGGTAEAETPAEATAPPPMKKAEVGVGKKGHYDGIGPVRTPVSVYFRVRERVAFEIDIPRHLKFYKAMNNNKGPATHEEFMDKIVKANRVDLPDLKPGERYLYNPEKEELFVVGNAKQE